MFLRRKPVALIIIIFSMRVSNAQSITLIEAKPMVSLGDTVVWTYHLPGSKDSFSNFKLDTPEGFTYIDHLGNKETTIEQMSQKGKNIVVVKTETVIPILMRAIRKGRFKTGSATALWHNGKVITSEPMWFTVDKRKVMPKKE